ncbi:DUF5123 domain-containing protein [Paenibacillus sp. WLX1005]|uniref:DUF5123 domain-containing protein n=1 Tax=Paenibacillus sp. WLX1005 TaxID=3243766 RepID=UPI0039845DCD
MSKHSTGIQRRITWITGTILAAIVLLTAWMLQSRASEQAYAAPAAHYVAPTGKDTNSGTLQSPWRTLQYAADHAEAGSTIYIRSGTYRERLNITRSGSASAGAITFTNYNKEQPILDGTGLSVDGIQGLIELNNASYITINGLSVRNYTTTSRDNVPVGMYVHGAGKKISLLNNKVYNIRNTATPAGSDLSGRDAHGIAVYGTAAPASIQQLTISGNELYNLVLGSSEAMVINGNVEQFEVTNNAVHDSDNIGIDVIGYEGTSPNDQYDAARNGTIAGNTVYNISANQNPSYGKKLPNNCNCAGGIYVDGGKSIVIERNTSYANDIGIELASEHKGKVTKDITVRSNVVYENRYTGIAFGGYDEERGTTTGSVIINNTLFGNDTLSSESGDGAGQLLIQYGTSGNTVLNNIMVSSASGVLIRNDYPSSNNKVDYNLYTLNANVDTAYWIWQGDAYEGLPAYQKASKQDAHSRQAAPQFINTSKADFHLQATSPARNSGVWNDILKGTSDRDGKAWVPSSTVTIGAYQ